MEACSVSKYIWKSVIISSCTVFFPFSCHLKINQGTLSVYDFNFLSSVVWALSIPSKTHHFSTFPWKLNDHRFTVLSHSFVSNRL